MTAIADLAATELATAIRARAISPVEAVESALARIDERRELNAFMAICADRARAEARRTETAIASGAPLGPLHGIPFSVKDLTNTEGVATTQGSALFADTIPAGSPSAPTAAVRSAFRRPVAASSASRRRSARFPTCRRRISLGPIPMSAPWRATSPIPG